MVDAAGTGGARDPWLLGLIAARAVTVRPVALASGPLIGPALALGFTLSDVAAEAGGVGGRGCQRPRARPTRERPPARQPHPLVLLHAVRNPLGASLGLPTCPLTADAVLLGLGLALLELGGLTLWLEGGEAWFLPVAVATGVAEMGAWFLLGAAAGQPCPTPCRPSKER